MDEIEEFKLDYILGPSLKSILKQEDRIKIKNKYFSDKYKSKIESNINSIEIQTEQDKITEQKIKLNVPENILFEELIELMKILKDNAIKDNGVNSKQFTVYTDNRVSLDLFFTR